MKRNALVVATVTIIVSSRKITSGGRTGRKNKKLGGNKNKKEEQMKKARKEKQTIEKKTKFTKLHEKLAKNAERWVIFNYKYKPKFLHSEKEKIFT